MNRSRQGATLLATASSSRGGRTLLACLVMAGGILGGEARAGNTDLRGTHMDDQSMSLIAYDSIKKEGTIATASTLLFFAVPNISYLDEQVDYVTMQAQYNCSQAGTWRGAGMKAFQIGHGLIAQDDEPTEWEVAAEGSVGYKNWEGVCKGLNTDAAYPTLDHTLDGVALGYRAYLKTKGQAA